MSNSEKYAIAIEDSGELFLFLDINRSLKRDIYVNFNEHHPLHKPHTSYHASGQVHHKGDGKMVSKIKIFQSPDNNFKGFENCVVTPLNHGNGRAWNIVCKPKDYEEMMVIADESLSPDRSYQIAVDIGSTEGTLVASANTYIILVQQQAFKQSVPWINVSLYEIL